MAIQLEFINLIVPIDTIKAKYPGGWEACLEDHKDAIGGRIWYDDYLFRDGAMSPMDMQFLVIRSVPYSNLCAHSFDGEDREIHQRMGSRTNDPPFALAGP